MSLYSRKRLRKRLREQVKGVAPYDNDLVADLYDILN